MSTTKSNITAPKPRHPYQIWLQEAVTGPIDETAAMPDLERLYDAETHERPIPGFDLHKTLDALSIREVPYSEAPVKEADGTHGWSTETTLAITRATQYPMAVYWHELGHILLNHVRKKLYANGQQPEAECEAEMVAYLLENIYQYNEAKPKSRAYIQTWASRGVNLRGLDYRAIYGAVNQIKAINAPEQNC